MLDLRLPECRPPRWPAFVTWENQSFPDWWQQNRQFVPGVPETVAEQWLHRHADHTHFKFLDPRILQFEEQEWTGAEILERIHLEFGRPLDPDWDHGHLAATARGWTKDTWDYPILALETPDGIRSTDGELTNVRNVVVEGSKRYRYLNALIKKGLGGTGAHKLIIMKGISHDE